MLKKDHAMRRHVRIVAGAALVSFVTAIGVAAAQEDDDDDPIIDFSGVIEAIKDVSSDITSFTSNFGETVKGILTDVLYQPFIDFLDAVGPVVPRHMVWLPDTRHPAVLAIHQDVFAASVLLSGAAFTAIGFMYMLHEPFGISYSRVRPLIPRLLAALAFGSVAPWALSYPVRISEQMARGLAPETMDLSAILMLSAEFILVAFFQAVVLLIVLAILMVQKVFIYYGAALAPLLAVFWALPFRYTKSIAERFIGAWWGFVLLPVFMVVGYRLTFALLSVEEFTAPWVAGLGGVLLLLGIPYIVVSAGMSAIAAAAGVASGVSPSFRRRATRRSRRGTKTSSNSYDSLGGGIHSGPTPAQRRENRFDRTVVRDDD